MRKGKGKKRGTAKAYHSMDIHTYIHIYVHKKNLNDEKEAKQPLLVPCLTDRETRIEWTRRSRRSENAKKPVKDKERKREARSLAAVGSHGCAAYLHLLSPLSPHHARFSCPLIVPSRPRAPLSSPSLSLRPQRVNSFLSILQSVFLRLSTPSKYSLSLTSFRTIETTSSHFFQPPLSFFLYFFVPMEQRSRLTFLSFGHLSFFRARSVSPRSVRKHCNLVAPYVYAHILIIAENGRGERERRNR